MKMTLNEVASAVHSQTDLGAWGTRIVTSVTFDTRQLQSGGLFVPLIAQRDGHDFVDAAIKNGAVGSFWQAGHANQPVDFPTIEVADTQTAFIELAKYYLHKVNPRVIAVTGSNGKTTTKDMIAAILATQSNTHKTVANYNNEIGVPYTILGMDTNTENLVLEMGMDRPGQLHKMSTIAEPDIAVITMIGEAHIEFFGTRDKIADAKMEIVDGLKADGTLIYDGDEPLLRERITDELATKTFGQTAADDLFAMDVVPEKTQTSFLTNEWPDKKFVLPLMGGYNVNNALAAIAVGQQIHVPVNQMITALKNFKVTAERTEWLKGFNGCDILSDVYNSNPTAVKEVLKNFVAIPTIGERKVVLGDMLELGQQSQLLHAQLAEDLDPTDIQEVFLYGKDIAALYDALQSKYSVERLHYYALADKDLMIEDIKASLAPEDMILLKASHGLHLEDVVAHLI
ncbi:UDP-N-acetylmuramoyl-tripeptide--D-alanyl-D-alanine ligase family protein [Agrilactobacillus composti DSM 18527 = JCM 14202]|uniref:UDP-N-acetylmuramoyl-tripeptide--D-alanyl-D-alanine ligase n=1 Tax=Agrilactobacillus composti DSM 18527 = JCM 14202 TaxID=1423734 RepID=X0PP97_9LACO|nr:UDP-N-acetylmuramoyl-tripeptide--D-alanyl-D-alanine ligase [Agrilactobacillus composti]KRM31535.1 UDP-N-acetylmuramoyl-tripeptide--D-alanyl-D-alanine ligase family protein [Agrilactobacillus composti DSM 18527 = JCM 14202]GAF39447.1 UDP-N-acetylmuramoylalanyl-D-glutamyl-2,6-diaminopimelate-D-alanyl-D-alanine ligase [Agrilactobacillus composti DSM 18527 = JCM 14202]